MALNVASLTAEINSFLHIVQVPFFLLTSAVKQGPQNLWLHGCTVTASIIIFKQREHVICYLIEFISLES